MKTRMYPLFLTMSIALFAVFLSLTACSEEASALFPPTPPNSPTASAILHAWDFEGSEPLRELIEYDPNVVTVTADPLNPLNKVMKCYLPDGSYRTECVVGDNGKIHFFHCDSQDKKTGRELWIGARILFIEQEAYVGTNNYSSTFQIGPVQNPVSLPGVTSAGHYQLQLGVKSHEWRWREFKSVYNPNEYVGNISKVSVGKWDRFVFHCIFRSDDNALMEVWQNDKKIYTCQRQNGIIGDRTRIQWGVYLGANNGSHTPLTCYFDDIKVGNVDANYDAVAPPAN